MSMLIYGYSLTMLSASSLKDIQSYYEIDFSKDLILSTINGFFAVGGLVGSFLTPYFIKITTKRYYASHLGGATISLQSQQSWPVDWFWYQLYQLCTLVDSYLDLRVHFLSELLGCMFGRLFHRGWGEHLEVFILFQRWLERRYAIY